MSTLACTHTRRHVRAHTCPCTRKHMYTRTHAYTSVEIGRFCKRRVSEKDRFNHIIVIIIINLIVVVVNDDDDINFKNDDDDNDNNDRNK